MTSTMLPLLQGPSCTFVLPLVALLNVGWPAVRTCCRLPTCESCSLTLDNLIKRVADYSHGSFCMPTNASAQPVPHLPIGICSRAKEHLLSISFSHADVVMAECSHTGLYKSASQQSCTVHPYQSSLEPI